MRLGAVLEVLDRAYPPGWAESWDRSGLVLGDPDQEVRSVLLAVDPTLAVAAEAERDDLLVTHHPLLLRGASYLPTTTGKGAVVTALIRSGTALWCGHTTVDRSRDGTVGAWIRALDLREARPLEGEASPAEDESGELRLGAPRRFGLGAVGELAEPTTVGALAERIAQIVPATAQGVRATGDPRRPVRRVALCPGAGDSFLAEATATGADVYVTSDLRHHPALEHIESAGDPGAVPALIDVGHSASEALWLPFVQELLRGALPQLTVRRSALSTDPWTLRVG